MSSFGSQNNVGGTGRSPTHSDSSSFESAVVAALAIFLFIGFRDREPPWAYDKRMVVSGLGFSIAFMVALPLVRSHVFRTQNLLWDIVRTCAIGSATCLPVLAAMLAWPIEIHYSTLAMELVLLFGLLLVNSLPISRLGLFVLCLCILALGASPSFSETSRQSLMDIVAGNTVNAGRSVDFVRSSLHDVKVTDYPVFAKNKAEPGGGFSLVNEKRLLLLTGDGEFYLISLLADGIEVEGLNVRSPFDNSIYKRSVEHPSQYFRVTGMLLEDTSDTERSLFVSYLHWSERNRCVTQRVAEAIIQVDKLGSTQSEWHDRFTSTPCLPPAGLNNETGGRMALVPPSTLLLTVGPTVPEMVNFAPDESVSYGKIIAIDRRDWSSRVFTKGHRDPQGLLVGEDGIWSTEHGPQGGDELNLIVEGQDYGWPRVTYGTEYGEKTWPRSLTPGEHGLGRQPVYAWVPSIGVSQLIRIKGPAFTSWRGDLIVGSLSGLGNGYSIYRVKIHGESAKVVERIRTGSRVRDLVEMPDGRIVVWDGLRTVQILEPATHIFSPCSGCHALSGVSHGIGPDLMNIVGSEVARHSGFQVLTGSEDVRGTLV